MCATRRAKYDYKDKPGYAQSLVHIADTLKMEFCNS